MMKNNFLMILPIVLILDLLIPFILAPTYKGYNHLTQVMSVLGNDKSPFHMVYNIWLIVYGVILIFSNFRIYSVISKHSTVVAIILFGIVLIYAIGGCILSGFFSVDEVKSLNTISEKIHGYGSVLGFTALTFAPLMVSIYGFHSGKVVFGFLSIVCFIMTIIFFTFFIMADKSNYKNTIVVFEGLWQRLSLFCMYLPLGCLVLFER